MARGDRCEQFGRLQEDGDGRWSFRRDDGGRWRLDLGWWSARRLRRLQGRRVRLVGVRDGFDLLSVELVEAVPG